MTSTRSVIGDAVADIATQLIEEFGDAAVTATLLYAQSGALADRPARLAELMAEAFREPFESDDVSQTRLVRGMKRVMTVKVNVLASEAAAIVETTHDLKTRKANLTLLVDSIRAATFVDLADAIAGRAYETAEDVADDEDYLADLYGLIQESDIDYDTLRDIGDVYVAVSEVLAGLEVRLPRVTAVAVVEIPASVLAYQLYDDAAKVDQVVNLNPSLNPILYDGSASALTEVL